MKPFSKKSRKDEAICPSCGEWKTTDFTPEELQEKEWECSDCMNKRLTHPEDPPENRGKKEISKYDPAYDFLKRLINLVVKEGVPPQEIKSITLSHPFQTLDDLGDLTAQIWTLATEKYHIPREWLIKKLPEKKGSLAKKAEYIYRAFNPHNTNGPETLVYRDPSIEQLTSLFNKSIEGLRYLVFPMGTIWVWDALELIHQDILQQLGYDEDSYEDAGEINTENNLKKFIKLYYTNKKADLWPAQEVAEDIGMPEWNSTAYNPLHDRDDSVSGPRPDDVAKEADEESPCVKCGHKKIDHWWSGQPEAWCIECDNEGRKLCKQYIPKQTKQASPETDHALAMSIGEDIIREYFFEKGIRWSQVVQFIKDQAPQLTDEDIVNLKTDTKYKLEQYKIQIDSKKNLDFYQAMSKVTKEMMKELDIDDPKYINNGYCGDWANRVEELVPGVKPVSFTIGKSGYPHVVLEYDGKFYDAATPQGVSDLKSLPFHEEYGKLDPALKGIHWEDTLEEDLPSIYTTSKKKASFYDPEWLGTGWWMSPQGEVFELAPGHEHREMLPEDTWTEKDAFKKGWVRLRILGGENSLIIEFGDINNISDSIDDFILSHPVDYIYLSGKWHEYGELPYEEVVEQGFKKAFNKVRQQKRLQPVAKKKGLSLADVLQILEQKGPKPTHVDYTDLSIEFVDGSKLSFDEATRKALEVNKSSSAESEEQERNKDAGTGFYDTPGNADLGKRPQSDESIWPADTWLPRGTEEEESQDPTNVMSSKKFSKRELTSSVGKLWLDPSGNEFKVARNDSHYGWIATKYKHNIDSLEIEKISNKMFREGWSRITPGSEFGGQVDYAIQIADIRNVPKYLDEFVAKTFRENHPIGLTDIKNEYIEIYDPFPSFQKAVNKVLQRKRLGKKQAFLKISQPESGYVDNKIGYTCGRCAYFKDGKCALVQGEIKAQGCCNYWGDKAQLKQEGAGYTKDEAVYIEYSNVDYRCDECVFFDGKVKTCTKVEGEISPTASCNLWQPISKKQSFSKKELKKVAKILKLEPYGGGVEFPVLVNPTRQEILGLAKKVGEEQGIRALKGNNVYIWPSYSATHDHVLEQLVNMGYEEYSIPETDYVFGPADVDEFLQRVALLNKRANPPSRFWIAPDGKEYNAGTNHGAWIKVNKDLLNQQGINTSTVGYSWDDMINKGWVRVSNEPAGTGFQIQVKDLKHLPSFLDDFISRNFTEGNVLEMGDQNSNFVWVYNPFPSIQKAVNRSLSLRNPVNAMLKKADVSGKQINDILHLIQNTGGTTYNLSQGNLAQTNNFAVSIFKDRERIVPEVDYDTLEGYIVDNQDLLNQSDKSLGAWSHDNQVYLDIVSTVPTKEEALRLAHENQQLAVFDLKTMTEIPTGMPALSKKASIEHVEVPSGELDVLINPTSNEIQGLAEHAKNKSVRALVDPNTGDLYTWEAYKAIHEDVIKALGLNLDYNKLTGIASPYILHFGGPTVLRMLDYQQKVREEIKHSVTSHFKYSFSKKELNIVKKAEEQILTQDQQDQIASVAGPTYNIALNNFASAVKRGHSKDRALEYAVDSVKNLEKVDPKKLIELANTYLKGLV